MIKDVLKLKKCIGKICIQYSKQANGLVFFLYQMLNKRVPFCLDNYNFGTKTWFLYDIRPKLSVASSSLADWERERIWSSGFSIRNVDWPWKIRANPSLPKVQSLPPALCRIQMHAELNPVRRTHPALPAIYQDRKLHFNQWHLELMTSWMEFLHTLYKSEMSAGQNVTLCACLFETKETDGMLCHG